MCLVIGQRQEGAQGGSSVGRGLRLLACPRESNILYIALAGDA